MSDVINIAAYRFAPLDNLPPLRARLLAQCKAWGLKGTILLSREGINLFVAGERPKVEALLVELRAIPGLADLTGKESVSTQRPFNRMLVRIKKEIIAFGVPGIDPSRRTSPKLPPRELKRWLDEGRPVVLLDTRNDYEVKLGTFDQALTLGLDHFRNFPAAVNQLPEELKEQPIVMFCTGGIRCEKAGPFMEREGYRHVFQLEGGILKYFEECGGAHYTGECFVFDQRVGVDPSLAETDNTQCFQCLSPLTRAEQDDPRYVPGQSCPYCYLTDEEQQARTRAAREAAIARATSPLPGSAPYDNYRPIHIPAKYDGGTLLEALCGIFAHKSADEWREAFARQLLCDNQQRPVEAEQRVRGGERYLNRLPAASEPDVNAAIRVLHEDAALVVIDKPAPLPIHPCGRFNRNTLSSILNEVYAPQKLRPVHRLDANTTGVVVLARTKHFASRVQPQFAAGQVEKVYLAKIQGSPPHEEFACDAAIGDEPLELGGRAIDAAGLPARTEFRVLRRFADGATLLEARPLTGRTNQIRLHLAHLGWPIVGDPAYLAGAQRGETQTLGVADPPLCLHALRITLTHPLSGERVAYESAAPAWSL